MGTEWSPGTFETKRKGTSSRHWMGGPLARLQMQTLHRIVWGLLPEVIARLRVTLQRPPSKGGSCIGYLNTYEVSIILLSGAAYGAQWHLSFWGLPHKATRQYYAKYSMGRKLLVALQRLIVLCRTWQWWVSLTKWHINTMSGTDGSWD